jgi:hypothetical protein
MIEQLEDPDVDCDRAQFFKLRIRNFTSKYLDDYG